MRVETFQLNENHIQGLIDEVQNNQKLLVEFYKDRDREKAVGNQVGVEAIEVDIVMVYAQTKEARKQLEKLGFRI